jgi:hypothetical protein
MGVRERMGRVLLTLAVVATPGFQVTADWSFGHITNPEWPPHAKYHLIVYHLTLVLFSAAAAAACWGWRPRRLPLTLAAAAVVAFWVPYYLAALFPQASSYATPELAGYGVPAQFVVGAAVVLVALLGLVLARPTGPFLR